MLAPPSLKHLLLYPVTAGVATAALAVTGMWWSGQDIEGIIMNGRVWEGLELWRALTSTLPHVNFFHLAFNLYWLWAFGTLVERVYGHLICAGIFLLLAFGSSLAEFSLLYGGVGLSGVGYGLWGLLWVLEKRDPRFAGAVDFQTSQLFAFWFFLCIVLTVANIMPVANIAHCVGAVLGALLGLAATHHGWQRWKHLAALIVVTGASLAGSTIFWPRVNLTSYVEPEVEHAGWEALNRHDLPQAVKLLKIAARMKRAPARAWYNLGIAYQRLGNYDAARTAYEHAASLPDADGDMQRAAQEMKAFITWSQENPRERTGALTNSNPATPAPRTNR